MWWEEERMLTDKDRYAIETAKKQDWTEIDENTAETEQGRRAIHAIISRKYHKEEHLAGID